MVIGTTAGGKSFISIFISFVYLFSARFFSEGVFRGYTNDHKLNYEQYLPVVLFKEVTTLNSVATEGSEI